jgi:hypothetical protein
MTSRFEPAALQLRRDLGPDEAAADHGDHAAGLESLECETQSQLVVAVAQREDLVVGAERESAGPGTGGDHDVRALEALAVRHGHCVRLDVERRRANAEAKVHVGFGDLLRRRQRRAFDAPLAGEHVLGERRTVVGGVGLVADQRDRAVVAVSTERFDQSPPGETGADDDDVVGRLQHGQPANIASHCSGLAGTSARLCWRTSPIGELGSAE